VSERRQGSAFTETTLVSPARLKQDKNSSALLAAGLFSPSSRSMQAQTARCVAAFEGRFVRPPPAITPSAATEAFDRLWEAFDQQNAMFVLRPEVNWTRLREQYRPKALDSKTTYEFATVCAEMPPAASLQKPRSARAGLPSK
jgi:hypothetical protein